MRSAPAFRFLNRDARWAGFTLRGVTVGPDGAVRLASRPLLRGRLAASVVEPDDSSGIAVTPEGTVYYADTPGHRIMRVELCDPLRVPSAAIGREGTRPAEFIEPRGLFVHAERRRLLVADTGNHRIQLFDTRTLQYLGSWAGFNLPWSIAGDDRGHVYVAERGARRVQKLDGSGIVQPDFWATLQSTVFLGDPAEVAVAGKGDSTEVYVLDRYTRKIVVVDRDGGHLRSFSLQAEGEDQAPAPVGLAVTPDGLYLGDRGHRLYTYTHDGFFVGAATGFDGPAAGVVLVSDDALLVHSGSSLTPVALERHGGYGRSGFLWGGPFRNPTTATNPLHRLAVTADRLDAGAHLRLHVFSTAGDAVPPVGDGERPLAAWIAQPADVTHCLFSGAPLDSVWIGLELQGEGVTSPRITQARLDFDHRSYAGYLPPIYVDTPAARQVVTRLLTVFESEFDQLEAAIGRLPDLYDPHAVPASFLGWLSRWLALDLVDAWPESRKRAAIATAFQLYAIRGTPGGLRRALKLFAGVDARIEEPIRHAGLWMLADDDANDTSGGSMLGVGTMLAPAEPLGAVLGATAALDQSYLIAGEDFGVPLFDDVAHRFTVQIYRGCAYDPARVEEVRRVIDREKPAHTDYHLCVVEPRMRIGFQARLGVDTIVGGASGPLTLGSGDPFIDGLVLGGVEPGSVGVRSHVGRSTQVGGERTTDVFRTREAL